MARTGRCTISREGRNGQNIHTKEILKSGGSHDRCRESFELHNHETGQVCGFLFKTFKEEVEAEDSEFDDTLRKEELIDHDNCMWLSPGGASSPSSCYQSDGLFGDMDFKIDAWPISLLSTASPRPDAVSSTQVTYLDGSKVNPMEEASLVLYQRKGLNEDVCAQEKLEEEVVSWLVTATENESPDSLSATCFEGETESSSGHCSIWNSKKRSELELHVATSVDSSFSAITDSSDEYSLCSSSSSSDYSIEVMNLEEYGIDKPLFWPSKWASEWGSGTKWDFFIMSPCKDLHKVRNSPKDTSRVLSPIVPRGKLDLENSCSKRLLFGTHSNSRDCLELKNTNGINDGKMRSHPLRRSKSTKTSTNTVPFPCVDNFETLTQAKVANESESMDTFEGFSDTHWISDKSSELAYTRSSCATSVCKSLQLSTSSIYSVSDITDEHMLHSSSSSSGHTSEFEAFEDSRTKSPVFWPSSCASGWGSHTKWDSFVMSPRKDICITSKPHKTSPDSSGLQVEKGNTDVEKGCSRRLEFNSDSKSLTNMTSCTLTVATEQAEVEALTKKSVTKNYKIVLEDLLLVEKLIAEGAIEQVLGLGEFDGHEGIESEFNTDGFCFV